MPPGDVPPGGRTSPDPDPSEVPSLDQGDVQPGDTPPSSAQTSGVRHLEEPPARGITNVWLFVLMALIVIIVAGAIAGAISYF